MREQKISLRPITPEDEPFLYEVYASTRENEMALLEWSSTEKEKFLISPKTRSETV